MVRHRDVTVHWILAREGTLEECVVALFADKERLMERIMELEGIAPKRIRLPDGAIATYHCPDHLIPVIESCLQQS